MAPPAGPAPSTLPNPTPLTAQPYPTLPKYMPLQSAPNQTVFMLVLGAAPVERV
jgi:hypothetical protein